MVSFLRVNGLVRVREEVGYRDYPRLKSKCQYHSCEVGVEVLDCVVIEEDNKGEAGLAQGILEPLHDKGPVVGEDQDYGKEAEDERLVKKNWFKLERRLGTIPPFCQR